jgi:hypothetical protein
VSAWLLRIQFLRRLKAPIIPPTICGRPQHVHFLGKGCRFLARHKAVLAQRRRGAEKRFVGHHSLCLCARLVIGLSVGGRGLWHGLQSAYGTVGRTEVRPTQGFVRAETFFISRGPLLGEFRPTAWLQVVGWSWVRRSGWADIRRVSARGWAVIHAKWDIIRQNLSAAVGYRLFAVRRIGWVVRWIS